MAYTVAKVDKVTRIKRKFMLKKFTSAEILKINISNPIHGKAFIAKIVKVFEQTTDRKSVV